MVRAGMPHSDGVSVGGGTGGSDPGSDAEGPRIIRWTAITVGKRPRQLQSVPTEPEEWSVD